MDFIVPLATMWHSGTPQALIIITADREPTENFKVIKEYKMQEVFSVAPALARTRLTRVVSMTGLGGRGGLLDFVSR